MDTVQPNSAHDPEDVGFLHDDQIVDVDLHPGTRPLAKQDLVAGCDVERGDRSIIAAVPLPTETTLPSCGFSCAGSGMNIPPAVLASASTRRTSTRSCKGRGRSS